MEAPRTTYARTHVEHHLSNRDLWTLDISMARTLLSHYSCFKGHANSFIHEKGNNNRVEIEFRSQKEAKKR